MLDIWKWFSSYIGGYFSIARNNKFFLLSVGIFLGAFYLLAFIQYVNVYQGDEIRRIFDQYFQQVGGQSQSEDAELAPSIKVVVDEDHTVSSTVSPVAPTTQPTASVIQVDYTVKIQGNTFEIYLEGEDKIAEFRYYDDGSNTFSPGMLLALYQDGYQVNGGTVFFTPTRIITGCRTDDEPCIRYLDLLRTTERESGGLWSYDIDTKTFRQLFRPASFIGNNDFYSITKNTLDFDARTFTYEIVYTDNSRKSFIYDLDAGSVSTAQD